MTEVKVDMRAMQEEDLVRVIELDAEASGMRRSDFFKKRWCAIQDSPDIYIALVALCEGKIEGFVLAHVLFGEFGTDERLAILDGLGVEEGRQRSGIGATLMGAIKREAKDRRCTDLRTQISWEQQDLLGFFAHSGFSPAAVNVLERDLNED